MVLGMGGQAAFKQAGQLFIQGLVVFSLPVIQLGKVVFQVFPLARLTGFQVCSHHPEQEYAKANGSPRG
ncbi:MAG: hypothetical protein OXH24_00615 [Cyanobacteria bacterium MAG IRC3_bin_20]|nr:hypothetical protein [Cyanobacteria bacterium MAG IRC3_bin_20]